MPRNFLGANQPNGEGSTPVTKVELSHAVYTGTELKALGAGLVPLYEEHTARLESHYSLVEWQSLDVMERALVIAQRRIKISLENIQAEAQIQQAKRNSRKR